MERLSQGTIKHNIKDKSFFFFFFFFLEVIMHHIHTCIRIEMYHTHQNKSIIVSYKHEDLSNRRLYRTKVLFPNMTSISAIGYSPP